MTKVRRILVILARVGLSGTKDVALKASRRPWAVGGVGLAACAFRFSSNHIRVLTHRFFFVILEKKDLLVFLKNKYMYFASSIALEQFHSQEPTLRQEGYCGSGGRMF